MDEKHSLVLCGGGLDTFVAAWANHLDYPREKTLLVYVDYGCKAAIHEMEATRVLCEHMNIYFGEQSTSYLIVKNFSFFQRYLKSALTSDGIAVEKHPRTGVASEWVPARNTVLMSLAIAMAENEKLARIVTGINKTAARAYPDNDAEWLYRFQDLVRYAISRDRDIKLSGPLAFLEKHEIVSLGDEIGIPPSVMSKSWSCYTGDPLHCGKCSSCVARKEAFITAEIVDSTDYAS